jgi:hypothetical protein
MPSSRTVSNQTKDPLRRPMTRLRCSVFPICSHLQACNFTCYPLLAATPEIDRPDVDDFRSSGEVKTVK